MLEGLGLEGPGLGLGSKVQALASKVQALVLARRSRPWSWLEGTSLGLGLKVQALALASKVQALVLAQRSRPWSWLEGTGFGLGSKVQALVLAWRYRPWSWLEDPGLGLEGPGLGLDSKVQALARRSRPWLEGWGLQVLRFWPWLSLHMTIRLKILNRSLTTALTNIQEYWETSWEAVVNAESHRLRQTWCLAVGSRWFADVDPSCNQQMSCPKLAVLG